MKAELGSHKFHHHPSFKWDDPSLKNVFEKDHGTLFIKFQLFLYELCSVYIWKGF